MATISIVAVVDVVAALADDSLDGNHYLADNNRHYGSTNEGTAELATKVSKGDQIVWTTTSLESEAYAMIAAIEVDARFDDTIQIRRKNYGGTGVTFWIAEVKKDLDQAIPYTLRFALGSRSTPMAGSASPRLVG